MILAGFLRSQAKRSHCGFAGRTVLLAVPFVLCGHIAAWGESVEPREKHIIGATALITEESTGFSFPARIDTGAKSCSLHVEEIEIEDESPDRVKNVGKNIRFLVRNDEGETEWIETQIASAVRIRTAAANKFDRRYKVPLKLQWEGFTKEVLVTLNDRNDMAYPLLIGRNFLRGDFLVDVEKAGD